jgi:outer membrane protein
MSQPLSQQYRIGLNISMHSVMRDIAQEGLRGKRQTVVNDVKRLYFDILQTQSSLESVEENIRFLRELDRLQGRYLKEQAVLKSEGLEVKARLAQAEQDQIVMRNNLATQKEQLNELMGRNILTEFPPTAATSLNCRTFSRPAILRCPAGTSRWSPPGSSRAKKRSAAS